jgi:hypothetical protein
MSGSGWIPRIGGCGCGPPGAARVRGRRPHPCSLWRPGSPVMAQCKLGRLMMGSHSGFAKWPPRSSLGYVDSHGGGREPDTPRTRSVAMAVLSPLPLDVPVLLQSAWLHQNAGFSPTFRIVRHLVERGQRYRRLAVIREVQKTGADGRRYPAALCRCDCENTSSRPSALLHQAMPSRPDAPAANPNTSRSTARSAECSP